MSRFEGCTIIRKTYKNVRDHKIVLDVLILKTISKESLAHGQGAPVLLRYHGGGLTAGSSFFPPFFAPWLLQFAEHQSAIIVFPDYRLIPESTVQEAIDDADDALPWVRQSLQAELASDIDFPIDVSRVMLTGDSAGGYLAIIIALSYPHVVGSVVAAYPLVAPDNPHFAGHSAKEILGLPLVPPELVPDHLALLKSQKKDVIVSEDPKAERVPLMAGTIQQGLLGDMFPLDQRKIFPLKRLDDDDRFPRGGLVVLHGRDDTVAPLSGSEELEKKLLDVDPELDFRLVVRSGEHGFDHHVDIKEHWLSEALSGVTSAWIA